jgi:hypothetical protein
MTSNNRRGALARTAQMLPKTLQAAWWDAVERVVEDAERPLARDATPARLAEIEAGRAAWERFAQRVRDRDDAIEMAHERNRARPVGDAATLRRSARSLSEEEREQIRKAHDRARGESLSSLARRFGVSPSTVGRIAYAEGDALHPGTGKYSRVRTRTVYGMTGRTAAIARPEGMAKKTRGKRKGVKT